MAAIALEQFAYEQVISFRNYWSGFYLSWFHTRYRLAKLNSGCGAR